ncbi:hypothetical protein JRQ81_012670 [Phrynocephalus forsythii]|uniref:Uncharacterized protein n=1 Tax=Phrynocephalus forsythii TaxID=171643 RepID=A0A9Q1B5I1_9SAUR|nr:hypothetical protein JRQ81_012670 [Phrynocephalus forsythii]
MDMPFDSMASASNTDSKPHHRHSRDTSTSTDSEDTDSQTSPAENLKQYSQMVQNIAKVMDLHVAPLDSDKSCKIFGHLNKRQRPPLCLGFIPALLKRSKVALNNPSSIPLMPRRIDNLYRTHGEETTFLSKHPLPNSVIVNASQNRAKSSSMSTPSNRESKKLDLIGRRHYSLASFALRNSNYLCAMQAYTRHVLLKMLPVLDALPDDLRDKATSYHAEALSLLDYETIAAQHAADAASRQLATAVFLHRHAWLRTANITDNARNRIEDSPFDGEGLFASSTDESLDNNQKMRKAAKSYAYYGASKQCSFRFQQQQPSWHRSNQAYQHRNPGCYSQPASSQPFHRHSVQSRQRQCQSSRRFDRKQKA